MQAVARVLIEGLAMIADENEQRVIEQAALAIALDDAAEQRVGVVHAVLVALARVLLPNGSGTPGGRKYS